MTAEIERILDNLSNIDCMDQADVAETASEARQLILRLLSDMYDMVVTSEGRE